jgi:hypothetical protein
VAIKLERRILRRLLNMNVRFWRIADIGQIEGKDCFCFPRSERFLNIGCVWLSVMIESISHPKGKLPVTTGK